MSLWQLILRQLRQRSLSSVLTALSVALGVMYLIVRYAQTINPHD